MIRKTTPERLSFFSDAIFAVLITVLVLELRPPEQPTFEALLERWPTWLSYAVSYLFIAIVWANHHYLLRYAREATPRLMWLNFAHLFSVSLLPLSTASMAVSMLSSQPVAPSARGQGIGKILLVAVENFARAGGFQRMLLSTTPFLDDAIRLYQRFGFERIREGPHDLAGTPLFTMEKAVR